MIFASNRVKGFIGETHNFTIPNIGVTGMSPATAWIRAGNFIQHLSVARRLTHVRAATS